MIINIMDSKINSVLKSNDTSNEHVKYIASKSFLWLSQHGTEWVKSPGQASRIINENNNWVLKQGNSTLHIGNMLIEILNNIKKHPLHYNGEQYIFEFDPFEKIIINNIKTPKGNIRKSTVEDEMIKFGTQALDTYRFVNSVFETIGLKLTSYKSAVQKNANK